MGSLALADKVTKANRDITSEFYNAPLGFFVWSPDRLSLSPITTRLRQAINQGRILPFVFRVVLLAGDQEDLEELDLALRPIWERYCGGNCRPRDWPTYVTANEALVHELIHRGLLPRGTKVENRATWWNPADGGFGQLKV